MNNGKEDNVNDRFNYFVVCNFPSARQYRKIKNRSETPSNSQTTETSFTEPTLFFTGGYTPFYQEKCT